MLVSGWLMRAAMADKTRLAGNGEVKPVMNRVGTSKNTVKNEDDSDRSAWSARYWLVSNAYHPCTVSSKRPLSVPGLNLYVTSAPDPLATIAYESTLANGICASARQLMPERPPEGLKHC